MNNALEPVPFEQLLQSAEPEQCLPVSVHDGDTMRVNVMFPFGNHKNKILVSITVRLLGYDCAEIVPKGPTRSAKDKMQEKILGTLGKWAFINKIGFHKNQMVRVKFEGMDKYGRVLGTVFTDNTNVNQYMLESNFAYSYEGGTKDCADYVSKHFNKFYAMINDGTIESFVSAEGLTELRKLVAEYIKM